jgi:hypothetical protein
MPAKKITTRQGETVSDVEVGDTGAAILEAGDVLGFQAAVPDGLGVATVILDGTPLNNQIMATYNVTTTSGLATTGDISGTFSALSAAFADIGGSANALMHHSAFSITAVSYRFSYIVFAVVGVAPIEDPPDGTPVSITVFGTPA